MATAIKGGMQSGAFELIRMPHELIVQVRWQVSHQRYSDTNDWLSLQRREDSQKAHGTCNPFSPTSVRILGENLP